MPFHVVPYAHVPSLEDLDVQTLTEMMLLLNRGLAACANRCSPMALTWVPTSATLPETGIRDHVHLHVVPRWTATPTLCDRRRYSRGARDLAPDLRPAQGSSRQRIGARGDRRSEFVTCPPRIEAQVRCRCAGCAADALVPGPGHAEARNIRSLYAETMWFGVLSGLASTYVAVFALRLGATNGQIGWLTALPA